MRRISLTAVLVLIALLIMGASSVGARQDGRSLSTGRGVTVHYVGHDAGEPTLGVDTRGRVFYAASRFAGGGFVPVPDVLRSTDDGESWEVVSPRVGPASVHASTGDPYVYVDNHKDGSRVFTVDLQGYVCSVLSYSDDAGESWITNPIACGRPYGDHQTVFAGPPVTSTTVAYPNVVYYCYQDVVSSSCSKSLDGGITFVPAGGPSFEGFRDGGEFCGGLHGHGYAGPDGAIYIPKVHCGEPWLAISRDEGLTWERVRLSRMPAIGHEASVAADAAGNVYYAFIGRDMLPYLVVSRDGGKKWGDPIRMSMSEVKESSLPSLDIGSEGNVAVAFMGSPNADGKDNVEEDAATVWNGYVTYATDALKPRPTLKHVQINPDSDPLLRGSCAQVKCGPVFDFIDVVVAPDGSIWSAFVDGCNALCRTQITANDAAEGIAVHIRAADLRRRT